MADFDSSLPIRTENDGDAVVKVADATTPSQQLAVNADGSVNITDNAGSLTVDAVDLDIRDIDASQDNIAISDGTDTLAINADGSLNITDNGGSLTVDATDLDIRDLSSVSDSVEVLQAAHDSLNANANLQVGDVDVGNANPVPVSDAGGSLTVDATDLDIRDLSATQDNVAISDGTDTLGVNADGSINVIVQEDPGTEVVNFNEGSAIAAGATSNHDYTTASVSRLYQVWGSASGKLKCEVQVETGAATGVFNTVLVGFNSTAAPNIDMELKKFVLVPSGAIVRVIRTNRDNQPQDVYSTIVLVEG